MSTLCHLVICPAYNLINLRFFKFIGNAAERINKGTANEHQSLVSNLLRHDAEKKHQ